MDTPTCDPKTDFAQDCVCILGIPFHTMGLEEASERVEASINERIRCNIVTPNLNFLAIAQTSALFRNALATSDLSLPDGMPFVWIARLLGLPITERVAGSDLFEFLSNQTRDPKIKVFFFGGEAGVAEQAAQQLNQSSAGMTAVGFHDPGFKPVSEMSDVATIKKINQARPDFIVAALGAKKGITWIEHNKELLHAPAISHLGAVVNFEAGNIERAPSWMQNTGLEWLWRIYQEPALLSRYAKDGVLITKLLFSRIIPYAVWMKKHRLGLRTAAAPIIELDEQDQSVQLTLGRSLCDLNLHNLRPYFARAAATGKDISIDFAKVDYLDSAFLGLLLRLYKYTLERQNQFQLLNLNNQLKKLFYWHKLEYLI